MKERLEQVLKAVSALGWEAFDLIYAPPASEVQLSKVEEELGFEIPQAFKKVLSEQSSNCSLFWSADPSAQLPEAFDGIFSGALNWDLDGLVGVNAEKDDWAFENWGRILAFCTIDNGDFLGINRDTDEVVYLSHDEGAFYPLAKDFPAFIANFTSIACVGPELWLMKKFTPSEGGMIDPNCSNAVRWRDFIGLSPFTQ